jgi:hypothetical protein
LYSERRLCVSLRKTKKVPLLEFGGNQQKILNLLGKTDSVIVAPLLGIVETGIIDLLHYRPHKMGFSLVINLKTRVAQV